MANPYHDETGKFCSRNEMGTALNRLAASGKIAEYLALKADYDEIEKDNVVIPKELYSTLVKKAHMEDEIPAESVSPAFNDLDTGGLDFEKPYKYLDGDTLAEVVTDWSFRQQENKEGIDYRPHIYNALEWSKYDREVVFAVVTTPGLDYKDKLNLVREHGQDFYYELADRYPEKAFGENKEEFYSHIEEESKKVNTDEQAAFRLNSLVKNAAQQATNSDDLAKLSRTEHTAYAYGNSGALVESPYVTKSIAYDTLTRECAVNRGGYWSVRQSLTRTLRDKGITIDSPDWDDVTPIAGQPSEDLKSSIAGLSAELAQKKKRHEEWDVDAKLEAAQAKYDAYAVNYKALTDKDNDLKKQILRTSDKGERYRLHSEAFQLRKRISEADNYLSAFNDYNKIQSQILKADF